MRPQDDMVDNERQSALSNTRHKIDTEVNDQFWQGADEGRPVRDSTVNHIVKHVVN